MINAALDIAGARAALTRLGRAQLHNYLQAGAAALLERCLVEDVPWTLALREDDAPRTLPSAELAAFDAQAQEALLQRIAHSARGRYGFAYESYMMVEAYKEGRDPGLLLHRVLEFLNSSEHLAFLHALTGDARIRRVSAQATRYRPGHFLKQHNDSYRAEGYLYAHVLNLSRDWRADWGGLLQFVDAQGAVEHTFMPVYNSLTLFRVPTEHVVSLVAPWAERPRHAITGWYQS